jgi:hypothetical protein
MVRRSATTATLQSYGVSVWRAGGWVWTVEMNIDETGYVMNLHECVCVCLRRSVSRERERERKRDMWRCQWCRRGRFNETNGWRARNVDGLTVTGREREREEKKTTSGAGWFCSSTAFRIACTRTRDDEFVRVCFPYDLRSKNT